MAEAREAPAGGAERAVAARAAPDWPVEPFEVRGDRDGPGAWLGYLAYRGVVGGAARLPRALRRALIAGLARGGRALDRRHADAARRFLEQAYGQALDPRERERLVLAAYRHLIGSAIEFGHLDRTLLAAPDPLALCDTTELPPVQELLASGTGALLATPHIGDWEAMAALAPLFGMRPLYVVSRPPRNRPLSAHFQEQREARGFRLIPRHGAIAAIPRIVAAGGTVALMLDQRARGKTVLAPFFGRPAHCERSIAVLARRLRVPVIVGAGLALPGGRYRLRFPRILRPEELQRMGPEQVMTAINQGFERMILEAPEQYLWLHDRYRKAPAPDAAAPPGAAGGEVPRRGAH